LDADILENDARSDYRHVDRTRAQVATLIRHASFQTRAVLALAISVIQPTFRTFLMKTIRYATLLSTTALLTLFAAVALASVARATDVKLPTALAIAAKPPSQNGFARLHHCPGKLIGQGPQAMGG